MALVQNLIRQPDRIETDSVKSQAAVRATAFANELYPPLIEATFLSRCHAWPGVIRALG